MYIYIYREREMFIGGFILATSFPEFSIYLGGGNTEFEIILAAKGNLIMIRACLIIIKRNTLIAKGNTLII